LHARIVSNGRYGHLPRQRLKSPERTLLGRDLNARIELLGLGPRGGGACVDPATDDLDVGWGQLAFVGRHLAIANPLIEQTFVGMARLDGRARFTASGHESPQPQVEPALEFVFATVAAEAVGLEDRPHLGFKADRGGLVNRRCWAARQSSGYKRAERDYDVANPRHGSPKGVTG
jgi:hypothetical protein